MNPPEYIESKVLEEYLFRNYSSYLTRFEQLAMKAVPLGEHESSGHGDSSKLMDLADNDDPEVLMAVREMDPRLREIVAGRILR